MKKAGALRRSSRPGDDTFLSPVSYSLGIECWYAGCPPTPFRPILSLLLSARVRRYLDILLYSSYIVRPARTHTPARHYDTYWYVGKDDDVESNAGGGGYLFCAPPFASHVRPATRQQYSHWCLPNPDNAPNNKTAASSSSCSIDVVAAELRQGVCCAVLSIERVHGSRSTSEINQQQIHRTPPG